MFERWNPYEIQLSCFMMLAVLSEIRECDSLNLEGLALLEFQQRIENDPYGAFSNWNASHSEPCLWLGVQCFEGKVQMLNLSGFCLEGTLAPSLKNLRYMRSLVMSSNRLSGSIPKEIGELRLLEMLDLSYNNLNGTVPVEIGGMPSLKCLLLCGNDFHGDVPPAVRILDYLLGSECNQLHKSFLTETKRCVQRLGRCFWWQTLNQMKNYFGINSFLRTKSGKCCFHAEGTSCCDNTPSPVEVIARRRLSGESFNLAAAPANAAKFAQVSEQGTPIVLRSGTFSVTLKKSPSPVLYSSQELQSSPGVSDGNENGDDPIAKKILLGALIFSLLVTFIFALIGLRRHRGAKAVQAQNASLLHRLSKVFVTGVPKLNSAELQTACEDFSNIIETFSGCLMYKGILSSGVEIAVLSTSIRSSQQWSAHAEREFKRKVETFSKINHKNFVNLLGYCEEEEPFVRMMVFEYAPNGNLYEHLHGSVKDIDHLDWITRMRIIMGTCYCLEYMHHELNPPIVHPNLQSESILLTDDYAAKIADVSFWGDIGVKAKISDNEELEPLHSNPGPTCKDNVHSLGIFLLEIISSKSLTMQAMENLSDEKKFRNLVDPSLKNSKKNELDAICEVIRECVKEDPRQRPTVREITSKLHAVTRISQEAATSRFSPLWWAELELMEDG